MRQGRQRGKVDKGEREKRTIKTHEDLVIYQKAFDAAMMIVELSKQFLVEERYSLTGRRRRSGAEQIRRSSRSVCANFAEAWRKRRYQASFVAKLNDCASRRVAKICR